MTDTDESSSIASRLRGMASELEREAETAKAVTQGQTRVCGALMPDWLCGIGVEEDHEAYLCVQSSVRNPADRTTFINLYMFVHSVKESLALAKAYGYRRGAKGFVVHNTKKSEMIARLLKYGDATGIVLIAPPLGYIIPMQP